MKNWVRHQFATERTKEGMQRPSLLCDVPNALCVGKNALVPPLQSHADMCALFGRFKSRLKEWNLHASSAGVPSARRETKPIVDEKSSSSRVNRTRTFRCA